MEATYEATDMTTSIDTLIKPHQTNTFGDIVRRKRMVMGLKQHDVATLVGETPWTIKQIERGAEAPSLAQRRALAAVLGLDDDALRRLPINDVPVGARRREHVDQVLWDKSLSEAIGESVLSPTASTPARLRNYLHVIVSHGETALRDDTNLRLAMIDDAGGAGVTVTVLADQGAHWFTVAIHYQATHDLFLNNDPDGETIDRSIPPEPDQQRD